MLTALILNTFFLLAPLQRPELVLAQGHIESGHNVKAIGKAKEKGAFQVKESDWGKVPRTWKKQADQNEGILDELLEARKGSMKRAVISYNGKGKKAKIYYAKVRKTAISIHILNIA